jgi:predicted GNAT superfamily acetyltransferase
MSQADIAIRPVANLEELKQIEDVQRATWSMTDLEVLPARFLHAMQFNGACLLAAVDRERVVGFVFGVLGTVEGLTERIDQVAAARLQMYSAIMGVLPENQESGVGYRLKLGQREFALRIGVRLITWTYDPLESRNAHFNLGKLGVVTHRYLRDFHGPMTGLNSGLPSDRFYVEWWVTSNRVKSRVDARRGRLALAAYRSGGAVIVNEAVHGPEAFARPPESFLRDSGRILLAEIPANFQALKAADMDLALAWRAHSRELFEHYFAANYLVTDFVRDTQAGGADRSYYVLTHMEPDDPSAH